MIAILAITIGACGTATEPAKTDNTANNASAEKKDETGKSDEAKKTDSTSSAEVTASTPTEAIKGFVNAIRAKDVELVKKYLSKQSLNEMEEDSKKVNKPLDEMLQEFVKAPLPFEGDPEIRNEKIDGDKATLEVKAEGNWEETKLVKEDGLWKIDS